MSGKRLIFLTQWFEPEPAMKGLSFANELTKHGFRVEVVTGFPNYPGGKLYDGYFIRPIRRERMGDVNVTRLALYPSHDKSRLGRILNYLSFFVTATFYLVFMARRADVIYAYHPPLTVGMAATIARFIRSTPVVLDIQDMWPDTLAATGMIGNKKVLRAIGTACRWTWRRADRIAVLSDGFRTLLLERGVPAEKIRTIYNWADEGAISSEASMPPAALSGTSKFRVLFAGNMGAAQALDSVLQAAHIVAEQDQAIEFCFLGSGIEARHLTEMASKMSLSNVRFLPRVPIEEVGAYLAAADCLLVHLKADPLFAITIPSKTQAYMAAGKPIVMAVEGDAANLVLRSGGGVSVAPENPQALADAVIGLSRLPKAELAELGAASRRFYEQELSFKKGSGQFAALLNELIET